MTFLVILLACMALLAVVETRDCKCARCFRSYAVFGDGRCLTCWKSDRRGTR